MAFYETWGYFSPTTLRYLKIAVDLKALFGPLKGLRIAEIGAGYGGQAAMIHCIDGFASYTIFDLPEPAALARRYCDKLGIDIAVGDFSSPQTFDLVISNYALSEIAKPVQDVYLANISDRPREAI